MIGVEALAAVSVFFPIMFFLISFIIGLASGATILIGQAWGAKNLAEGQAGRRHDADRRASSSGSSSR